MNRMLLVGLAFGLACVGLNLTACNQAPLAPQTTGYRVDVRGAGPVPDLDVVQWVNGSAHEVGGSRDLTRTVNICKYSDGTVEGWYHLLVRGPGPAHIRVRIECLNVVGNQAWATGTIVAAAGPENIGRPYSLHFVDNGEGKDAMPDEFGGARYEDLDCMTEPDIPTHPVTGGNLTVGG